MYLLQKIIFIFHRNFQQMLARNPCLFSKFTTAFILVIDIFMLICDGLVISWFVELVFYHTMCTHTILDVVNCFVWLVVDHIDVDESEVLGEEKTEIPDI